MMSASLCVWAVLHQALSPDDGRPRALLVSLARTVKGRLESDLYILTSMICTTCMTTNHMIVRGSLQWLPARVMCDLPRWHTQR